MHMFAQLFRSEFCSGRALGGSSVRRSLRLRASSGRACRLRLLRRCPLRRCLQALALLHKGLCRPPPRRRRATGGRRRRALGSRILAYVYIYILEIYIMLYAISSIYWICKIYRSEGFPRTVYSSWARWEAGLFRILVSVPARPDPTGNFVLATPPLNPSIWGRRRRPPNCSKVTTTAPKIEGLEAPKCGTVAKLRGWRLQNVKLSQN